MKSLLFLSRLPPDVKVYPGHGEATTIEQEQRITVKVQQMGSDKAPVEKVVRLYANIGVLYKDQEGDIGFYFDEERLDPGKTFNDYGIQPGDCIEVSRVSLQEMARIQDHRLNIYSYLMIKRKNYPHCEWEMKQQMFALEEVPREENFPTCIPEPRLGTEPLPICW